jgi:hypothetical protein
MVALLAVAAVAAVAIGMATLRGRTDSADHPAQAAGKVAAWVAPNLPDRARISAPGSWRDPLRRAGPGWTVVGYQRTRPGDVLILEPAQAHELSSTRLQRLLSRSELLATFSGVQVRQVLPTTRAAALQARRDAGGRLVDNLDVRLTPGAWRDLVAGVVDTHLVDLLAAAAAAGHTVDVAAFDRDEKSRAAGAPARSMRVTAVDGQLVEDTGGAAGLSTLRALQLRQPGTRGDVTVSTAPRPAVLQVTYPLPGQP